MKLLEFFEMVENHELLTGMIDSDNIYVKCGNFTTRLTFDAILDNDRNTLLEILLGIREPIVLAHMSRVVGYFSMINNWNKSKLGELKDRQAGNYSMGDSEKEK